MSTIQKATHCYVGSKPCGCVVAGVVDEGTKETARDVADFIRSGLSVLRLSLEEYRKGVPWPRCEACTALRKAAVEKAEAKKASLFSEAKA